MFKAKYMAVEQNPNPMFTFPEVIRPIGNKTIGNYGVYFEKT